MAVAAHSVTVAVPSCWFRLNRRWWWRLNNRFGRRITILILVDIGQLRQFAVVPRQSVRVSVVASVL